MKVLLVSDVHSEMRGGVPAETRALAEALIRDGHSLALLADVPMAVTGLRHFPLSVSAAPNYAEELNRALTAFEPDVAHVMAMSTPGLLACAKAFRTLPWLFTCHSVSPHERVLRRLHAHDAMHYGARAIRFLPNSLGWRWIFLSNVVPLTIVHSAFVERCVRRYGMPGSRIERVALGCADPTTWTVAASAAAGQCPRIMTIAGIAHSKGLHDGMRAVAGLRKMWPRLRYDIVGEVRDASYMHYLQSLLRSLALEDAVHVHVDASEEVKTTLLSQADLYLQPSHEEGFCLSFAEAAAVVGRLVGTSAGAMANMCAPGDDSMRVVPCGAVDALQTAMASLLPAPVKPEHLASRARWFGSEFSWGSYVRRHVELYRRLTVDRAAFARA